mmetsp:Transcript_24275/g.96274  ORF Transcript_24275/g.96274 Transcript_24275/m.96274 type:complete len:245 (+) Transcript_24275:257-991(+)
MVDADDVVDSAAVEPHLHRVVLEAAAAAVVDNLVVLVCGMVEPVDSVAMELLLHRVVVEAAAAADVIDNLVVLVLGIFEPDAVDSVAVELLHRVVVETAAADLTERRGRAVLRRRRRRSTVASRRPADRCDAPIVGRRMIEPVGEDPLAPRRFGELGQPRHDGRLERGDPAALVADVDGVRRDELREDGGRAIEVGIVGESPRSSRLCVASVVVGVLRGGRIMVIRGGALRRRFFGRERAFHQE